MEIHSPQCTKLCSRSQYIFLRPSPRPPRGGIVVHNKCPCTLQWLNNKINRHPGHNNVWKIHFHKVAESWMALHFLTVPLLLLLLLAMISRSSSPLFMILNDRDSVLHILDCLSSQPYSHSHSNGSVFVSFTMLLSLPESLNYPCHFFSSLPAGCCSALLYPALSFQLGRRHKAPFNLDSADFTLKSTSKPSGM